MPKNKFFRRPTSIRLDEELRDQAETAAHAMGMTFSAFTRQAIIRNIHVAFDIERQLNERNSRLARGLPISSN
jgi:antitoxin component of RelBE/YafQ-DinJ toxin-antitoxin module